MRLSVSASWHLASSGTKARLHASIPLPAKMEGLLGPTPGVPVPGVLSFPCPIGHHHDTAWLTRTSRVPGARRPTSRSTQFILGVALSLAPVDASGWGSAGHEIGAAIAEQRLTPDAKAMVRDVAGNVPLSDPSIATWADAHRTPDNAPWHYVNIPMTSGRYNPDRDCPTGSCAVAQMRRARDELARGRDAERRLEALRWIVHLVVDLHQPLHAGDGWDRGGNDLRVRLGNRKQPITLHSVWD